MKNKLLITSLIISTLFFAVAYAAELINSSDVSFSNGLSGLKANNVQDAINELYDKTVSDSSCKNVSAPKLGEGLVPVTIENDGRVTYADATKSWYNHCDKIWANAVILEDGTNYKVGDTISETDIQSYFVWIPKYKYKLWNVDSPSKGVHEIDIVFDKTDTTDVEGVSCKTPMISGESGNCNNGEYMTHPAFISMNTNGFWVGKFVTGYKGATSIATSQVNANDTSKVIIKPNVYSWRNINVYNAFLNSYNYKRNLDSHMMKNTEWGAVAYLSHSKYGIDYKMNVNNNSNYKTGYSANLSTNQLTVPGDTGDGIAYNFSYNTEIGYLASSTGNISGLYDMSGGTRQYVMSYISGKSETGGFSSTYLNNYDEKYYDIYSPSSARYVYKYKILGDATGELGPFKNELSTWYYNNACTIDPSSPWITRSGQYNFGSIAGQFYFDWGTGTENSSFGFRIVLTP